MARSLSVRTREFNIVYRKSRRRLREGVISQSHLHFLSFKNFEDKNSFRLLTYLHFLSGSKEVTVYEYIISVPICDSYALLLGDVFSPLVYPDALKSFLPFLRGTLFSFFCLLFRFLKSRSYWRLNRAWSRVPQTRLYTAFALLVQISSSVEEMSVFWNHS